MGEMKTSEMKWTFLDPEAWDVPLLAQAWMSLVPPAQGMVVRSTWGKRLAVRGCEGTIAGSWYADLDSPANWGHWLAWTEERVPGVRLGRDDMAEAWEALRGGAVYKGTVPRALLGLFMKVYGEMPTFPPSVLAWWKAEQEDEAE